MSPAGEGHVEILVKVLFWIHLMGLALGGAAAFGIPVIGRRMPTVPPETRPLLMQISKGLSRVGQAGLGLLIVTGPLIVWLKYGGFGGFNTSFWVKMTLVVLLLVGVSYSGILLRRVMSGDVAAAPMLPRMGIVNTLLLLGIVLSAVFAFEP